MWHGERAPKDNTKRETFFSEFQLYGKCMTLSFSQHVPNFFSLRRHFIPYSMPSCHIAQQIGNTFQWLYVCFYVIKIIFLYINCCETKRIVFRNLNAIFADMWIAVKTIMKYIWLLITYILTFIEIKTAAIERSTGSQTKITHS